MYQHNDVVCARGYVGKSKFKMHVYVYLVDGMLMDTGPSRLAREYISFFKTQSISQVVLTHFHEDHVGNAPWLAKQGVKIYIHPNSISECEEKTKLPLYRGFFWGNRDKFAVHPLGATLDTENKTWQVIETPGHSYDHVVFYDPSEGALFTGDLFVTCKTKMVLRVESIPQIVRSLQTVLQYDFKTVYCAHAGVVENGREMVAKKLDFLNNLKGEVLDLHQKGWSVPVINKKVYPDTAPLTYISGKEWSSEHIIRSIIQDDWG